MDVPSTIQQTPQVLSYRAALLQKTSGRVPYTAEGLPTGFYRTDLLPNTPTASEEELEALQSAYTDLSFEFGYPTLPDGRPFWHKLDFEPGFAFGVFNIYLEQINGGPRELTMLADDKELIAIASKMAGLPDGQAISKDKLRQSIYEFSILYYWRVRAKAHDLYKEAAYRHLRLRRQMNVEDTHYTLATALMKKLDDEVLKDKSFWENMSGKTAVDLLSKLVSIQRISVGLPAQGPLSQKETPEDTAFEMILRTIGQKAGQGTVYENNSSGVQGRGILDSVLADKDSSRQLQEVIIRVSQTMQKRLPNPNSGDTARQFKGRGRTNENIGNEELAAYDVTGAPGSNLDDDAIVVSEIDVTPIIEAKPEGGLKTDDAPKT